MCWTPFAVIYGNIFQTVYGGKYSHEADADADAGAEGEAAAEPEAVADSDPDAGSDRLTNWHFDTFFSSFRSHPLGTERGTGLDNIRARLFIYKSIKIESFLNAKQAIPIVRERGGGRREQII